MDIPSIAVLVAVMVTAPGEYYVRHKELESVKQCNDTAAEMKIKMQKLPFLVVYTVCLPVPAKSITEGSK